MYVICEWRILFIDIMKSLLQFYGPDNETFPIPFEIRRRSETNSDQFLQGLGTHDR